MTKKITIILSLLIFFALNISVCNAQTGTYRPINDPVELEKQTKSFTNAAGIDTKPVTIGSIAAIGIRLLLSFLGVIFIILIIYAGFMWMTSAGNEEKIGTAKKIMISAIIGLAIILFAYAITIFVIDKMLGATTGTGGGSRGTFIGS